MTVLPRFGGKIASIRIGAVELLQAPLAPIQPRTQSMAFDDGDASGWDECLPSVAACAVATGQGITQIPDHGDLWRVEWEKPEQERDNDFGAGASVVLIGKCFSLPLELERTIALSEGPVGWRLDLNYKLTNTGTYSVPWSWAAHPLFAVEAGDRIVLPKSISSLRVEGSGKERLGRKGDSVTWPVMTFADGNRDDLSIAECSSTGIGDKLFAGPLSAEENWCTLDRRSAGVRIRVRFDASATPYLGLWMCYGGWPEKPGPKQVCVALEPSTAPVDSLAARGPWSRALEPGETFSWPMIVEFETAER